MKRNKGNKGNKGRRRVVMIGILAVLVVLGMVITLVWNTEAGIGGAVLACLIVAVSVLFGWMVGINQRIQRRNYDSYLKGYHEGMAQSVIPYHTMCRCVLTITNLEKL